MLRPIKTNYVFLVISTLMAAMTLNACGEKTMSIPNTTVYSFKHKVPTSFSKNPDFTSDEYKSFMGGDVFFWGGARRNTDNVQEIEFDIGVLFNTPTEGRRIFVEKMILDTPNLKKEFVANEFVKIDIFDKSTKTYHKRFAPFKNISGNSIPLTADYFTLRVDYKLDDGPTEQMSIRFDNTTFLAPIL